MLTSRRLYKADSIALSVSYRLSGAGPSGHARLSSPAPKDLQAHGGQAAPAPTDKIAAIRALRWEGSSVFMPLPNTGEYDPALYVPHAIGLFIGRRLGLSVLHSYDLARVFGALASVVVATLAITLAGRGAFAAATVLSTPMFLFLVSSVTQDGLMIAVAGGDVVARSDRLALCAVPRHGPAAVYVACRTAGSRAPRPILGALAG
jgi:hypothetical protein